MGISSTMTFFQYLHHVDKDITIAINSVSTPVSDFVWQVFSNKEIWFVLYLAVAVMLIVKLGWKKGLIVIASVILTILACDQTSNFLKYAVQRLRPCYDGDMISRGLHVLEDTGGLYGFFSAHAANAIGFAVCTHRGFKLNSEGSFKTYGTAVTIWALLVGISRVFVGKHFFGDVCVGFAVGFVFAYLFAYLAAKACRRL